MSQLFKQRKKVYLVEKNNKLLNWCTNGDVSIDTSLFKNNELSFAATCAKNTQVQTEGNRVVERIVSMYNVDVVLSIGKKLNQKMGNCCKII